MEEAFLSLPNETGWEEKLLASEEGGERAKKRNDAMANEGRDKIDSDEF